MRQITWERNYRRPLTSIAATAAVAQAITALALVTGPSPLPEVIPCRSRSSRTDVCPCLCVSVGADAWCTSILIPYRQLKQGGCWLMMLSVLLLRGREKEQWWRDRDTNICRGTARFARAPLSEPLGINFSDVLHLSYDCSTSFLTLNCLEIKKRERKKKEHLTLHVGA